MGNFKHIKMAVIVLLSFLVAVAFGAPPRVIKTVPENGAQSSEDWRGYTHRQYQAFRVQAKERSLFGLHRVAVGP